VVDKEYNKGVGNAQKKKYSDCFPIPPNTVVVIKGIKSLGKKKLVRENPSWEWLCNHSCLRFLFI